MVHVSLFRDQSPLASTTCVHFVIGLGLGIMIMVIDDEDGNDGGEH